MANDPKLFTDYQMGLELGQRSNRDLHKSSKLAITTLPAALGDVRWDGEHGTASLVSEDSR
ncbi:MAG TPA: hypothetical protein VM053_01840 [Gemmatimonadaceae bacterium]|nr:hypothetical protein [Gemmatimonadaceae bacterium]